jgi:hypothetical protein
MAAIAPTIIYHVRYNEYKSHEGDKSCTGGRTISPFWWLEYYADKIKQINDKRVSQTGIPGLRLRILWEKSRTLYWQSAC